MHFYSSFFYCVENLCTVVCVALSHYQPTDADFIDESNALNILSCPPEMKGMYLQIKYSKHFVLTLQNLLS